LVGPSIDVTHIAVQLCRRKPGIDLPNVARGNPGYWIPRQDLLGTQ
jgi:hypothetical protein